MFGALLKCRICKTYCLACKGRCTKGIDLSDVKVLPIPVPEMKVQKQLVAICEQSDKSKFVIQQALDKAQLLFDSLMQKYFG